jgi:hypothetical protein
MRHLVAKEQRLLMSGIGPLSLKEAPRWLE